MSSHGPDRASSTSSNSEPAPFQSFFDRIKPRPGSTSRHSSPKPQPPSTACYKSRDESTWSQKTRKSTDEKPRTTSSSSKLSITASLAGTLCLNKPLPALPPLTPISPPPLKPSFSPLRPVRQRVRSSGPHLGEDGWGRKEWGNIRAVKAEKEWLGEQKREYAGQEKIYKEIVVKKIERERGERVVSGEEMWENELQARKAREKVRSVRANVGGRIVPWEAAGAEDVIAEPNILGKNGRERQERRRSEMAPEDGMWRTQSEELEKERQSEQERWWARHPPTPCAWPGMNESDEEWDFDSPPGSARTWRRGS